MVTNSFSSILSSISNNLAENLIIPQLINKILNIEEEKWGISYKTELICFDQCCGSESDRDPDLDLGGYRIRIYITGWINKFCICKKCLIFPSRYFIDQFGKLCYFFAKIVWNWAEDAPKTVSHHLPLMVFKNLYSKYALSEKWIQAPITWLILQLVKAVLAMNFVI